jgi:hypothetical protein
MCTRGREIAATSINETRRDKWAYDPDLLVPSTFGLWVRAVCYFSRELWRYHRKWRWVEKIPKVY